LTAGEIISGLNDEKVTLTPGEDDILINIDPYDVSRRESFPQITYEILPELESSDAIIVDQIDLKLKIESEAL
jgi:hypothetical protein